MIGQTISYFKIVENLGEGCMSVVYKTHDIHIDSRMAIKLQPFRLSASELDKARFILEAKDTNAFSQLSISTIHDINVSINSSATNARFE